MDESSCVSEHDQQREKMEVADSVKATVAVIVETTTEQAAVKSKVNSADFLLPLRDFIVTLREPFAITSAINPCRKKYFCY